MARSLGFINGYEGNLVLPYANISRQEAVVMIAKVIDVDQKTDIDTTVLNSYIDAENIPEWSKDSFSMLIT